MKCKSKLKHKKGMANKVNIEEQVAQLSQEQQDKIIKVGKIATALQLIGGIPWIIVAALGVWAMINPPLRFDYANYDKVFIGLMTWIFIGAVYIIGILLFVKIRYPYYSDAKWRYINKTRKNK